MVFDCLSALDSAKVLRDTTQLFQQLLRNTPNEDNKQIIVDDYLWKQRLSLLMNDYKKLTIEQLRNFWDQNNKTLSKLNDDSKRWLITIATNRKCITQLVNKFYRDADFEKHMQIFGANDPIQQTRAIALTNVRNSVVGFLKNRFYSTYDMSDRLRELANRITVDDLTQLEIVVTSWNHLLIDTFDATQYKFQQDKELLSQLTAFTYLDENIQEKDGLQYLQAILGEVKQQEQDEEKKMNNTITQNEFDAFTDRLLMFMTGDSGNVNVGDVPIRPIHEMTINDVVDLFKARKSALTQCGVSKFSDFEYILKFHQVDGPKLIEAFKQSRHDIQPISNLVFGEDQQLYDKGKQDKIISEIIKVIDFQLLRDKVENELIPKYNICKKIAKHRLLYYSEGGRNELNKDRHIPIDKDFIEFEQIEQNWNKYVIEWEREITQLRLIGMY